VAELTQRGLSQSGVAISELVEGAKSSLITRAQVAFDLLTRCLDAHGFPINEATKEPTKALLKSRIGMQLDALRSEVEKSSILERDQMKNAARGPLTSLERISEREFTRVAGEIDLLAAAAPPGMKADNDFQMGTDGPSNFAPSPPPRNSFHTIEGSMQVVARTATISVAPTIYPESIDGAIVVENFVTVNIEGSELRHLSEKLDGVIEGLRGLNEIAADLRDKLIAEISAGQDIIKGPKPQRSLIELLLVRPLRFIAKAAGSTLVSEFAKKALELLLPLL
jgi:hypothetical protein